MDKPSHLLLPAREWLAAIHPVVPWALLTLVIFLAVRGTRHFLPSVWMWIDSWIPDGLLGRVLLGLPSVLAGALATALAMGGEYALLWWGAFSGAVAPVMHHILKASPVQYQGAVRKLAERAGITLLVLGLSGCGVVKSLNDARVTLCDLLGDEHEAVIAAEAKKAGLTPAALRALWEAQCLIRMKQTEEEVAGSIGSVGAAP